MNGIYTRSTNARSVGASVVAALGALLLAAPTALALPDLSVTVTDWQQQTGTTLVDVTVKVTNIGDTTADAADSTEPFVDVLVFENNQAQPVASDHTTYGDILDPLGPGQSWTQVFTIDYEVPGNYSLWVMVDAIAFAFDGFGLPETSKMNNVTGPVNILVQDPDPDPEPDLIISSFTASVDGAQVQYSVIVQNVGQTATQSGIYVDVLFDSPDGQCPPAAWQSKPISLYGNVDQTLDALGPGESTEVKLIGAPSPGTHQSCAMVDLDDQLVESNEDNNFGGPVGIFVEDQGTGDCPDLRIDTFKVQALAAEVTYTVKVTNNGPGAAGTFTVDLYTDSPTQPVVQEPAEHFWTVPALAAGASWEGSWTESNAANGQKNAWVWIDKEDATQDCALANNTEGPYPYTVAVADDRPDLVVVGDVEWTINGTQLCYEATIFNKGNAEANEVPVDLFFSYDTNPDCLDPEADLANTPVQTRTIASLGAGATVTLDFCWDEPVEGEHQSWLKIDCFKEIDETDETNNDKGPIVVSYAKPVFDGPDLFLADFKGKVSCTNVDYVAKVCNTGDEAAGTFQIDLYYDRETNPNYDSGPGDKTVFYPDGLPAGECLDVVLKRESTPSGTYQSWFVTDTALQVPEKTNSNPLGEGNNISKVNLVVDAAGCGCENNVLIESNCSCGGQTVGEGYCCNGMWQLSAFDLCGDIGTGDGDTTMMGDASSGDDLGGSTGGDSDLGGGTGGPRNFVDTSGATESVAGDCSASPMAGSALPYLALLLAFVGLALRLRRREERRPVRIRRRQR